MFIRLTQEAAEAVVAPPLEPADIEAAGVDPAARAGTLDLAQFAALGNAVAARREMGAEAHEAERPL